MSFEMDSIQKDKNAEVSFLVFSYRKMEVKAVQYG